MAVQLPMLKQDVERNYMNCFEYEFWYMLRQAGIYSNFPILGTSAFYHYENLSDALNASSGNYEVWIPKCYIDNLKRLECNMEKYYDVTFQNYSVSDYPDFFSFVKEAVSQNKSVFSIYDNYFNTTDNEKYYLKEHSYHGTVILGYDEKKMIYMTNKDNINIRDMEDIVVHCMNKFKEQGLNTYISNWEACALDKQEMKHLLEADFKFIAEEWENEIHFIQGYLKQIMSSKDESEEQLITNYVYLYNLFVSISTGLHGNFLYRLRLLEELHGKSQEGFFLKFLYNRKHSTVIANIIGKASFLVKVNRKEGIETMERGIAGVNRYFVEESRDLLEHFKKINIYH